MDHDALDAAIELGAVRPPDTLYGVYEVATADGSTEWVLMACALADRGRRDGAQVRELSEAARVAGAQLEGSTFVPPLARSPGTVATSSLASSSPSSSSLDGDAAEERGPHFAGQHVTTDAGSGVVPAAPAHGQDDFDVWRANGGGCGGEGDVNGDGDGDEASTEALRVFAGDDAASARCGRG